MFKEMKNYYQMRADILPFVEYHWNYLWYKDKSKKWRQIVGMVLAKYITVFKSGIAEMGTAGWWTLRNFDPIKDKEKLMNLGKKEKKTVPVEKRRLRSNTHSRTQTKEKIVHVSKRIKEQKSFTLDPLKELASVANDWRGASQYRVNDEDDDEDYSQSEDDYENEETSTLKREARQLEDDISVLEDEMDNLDNCYFFLTEGDTNHKMKYNFV